MSSITQTVIYCDTTGCTAREKVQTTDLEIATAVVKKMDWTRPANDEHYCPDCSQ